MTGYIHSLQTLGAVDGPGIRFVIFVQGCPLRCIYCHNPDTWEICAGNKGGTTSDKDTDEATSSKRLGTPYTVDELVTKVLRYRSYFGAEGGVTVSGGEPLLQAEFVAELFQKLHEHGINTCLDTSGNYFTGEDTLVRLLRVTDLCICDIKFTTEEEYKKYTGGSLEKVRHFLKLVEREKVDLWVRHVVVPGYTDSEAEHAAMRQIAQSYNNLKKIELLPFRKICMSKYEALGIQFPLKDVPEA